MQSSNSMGGMNAASLQDMQQRLQQQFQPQQQQQQQPPTAFLPQQQQQVAAMAGSFPAGVNPQQFAALQQQQQQQRMNSNTALAMMQQHQQQQQQQQQQHSPNAMMPNAVVGAAAANNNTLFNNFGAAVAAAAPSPMDASTGSSARLMAMAGMGLAAAAAATNANNSNNNNPNNSVDINSTMQNMQALLQQQQQKNFVAGARPQDQQQQQLLLQTQLANLQKQMQQQQQQVPQQQQQAPQQQQQQPPQANTLLAHQQQLIQQMQQQQQQGGNTMPQQMTGGNDAMMGMMPQPPGMLQQRRSITTGSMQFPNAAGAGNNSNTNTSNTTMNGLGSLDEQRLRMHQQNLLRSTSASAVATPDERQHQQQQAAMFGQPQGGGMSQQQQQQHDSAGNSVNNNNSTSAIPSMPQQQPFGGGNQNTMPQQQQQQFHTNNNTAGSGNNTGMTDSSVHSYRSATPGSNNNNNANTAASAPGNSNDSGGEHKTFLDGSFNGGWQSNADLPDRRQVIFRILEVIRQMRPDTNRVSSKLPHMAKSLEEHLYRSAQTKEEYMDFSTLRRRLQAIAHGLEMHRSTSTESMNQDQSSQRGTPQPHQQQQQQPLSNHSSRGSFHAGNGNPQQQQGNANWSGNNNNNNGGGGGNNMQMMAMNAMQQQQQQTSNTNMQQASMDNLRQNFNTANAQNSNWSNNSNGSGGNTPTGNGMMMGQTSGGGGGGINNLAAQQAMAQRQQAMAAQHQQQGMSQQPGMPNLMQQSSGGNFGQQQAGFSQGELQQNQQAWAASSSGSLPSASGLRLDGTSTTTGGSTDPQKKKVILQQQQRLLLLRHASKCTAGASCSTKFCAQMVTLWRHMKACRNKNCKTPHCVSSRCVLNHYRICKSNGKTGSCEVCGPVMMKIKQKERDDGSTGVDPLTKDMPLQPPPTMTGSGSMQQQHVPSMDSSEEAQLKKVQEQQTKLKRQLESLKQLQKKQEELLKQQRRLEMHAQQVQDPNSPQAQQLRHQQLLLQQLQKKCQNQQLLLQQEVQMQMSGGAQPLVQPQPLQVAQIPSQSQPMVPSESQAMLIQQRQQELLNESGHSSPPPTPSGGAFEPQKKRRSSSSSRGKLEGGKGRRGGKGGKALSLNTAAASSTTTTTKKRSSSHAGQGHRKKRSSSASQIQHAAIAEAAKVASEETKEDPKPSSSKGPEDTSLISSMAKEDVQKHMDSLNKKIRLSSRTVTHKCMPLVQGLIDDPFGWVFHDAVDPVALGLPDYFEVVKTPMCLELVKKKLENAIYSDVESFARDVRLVFENAILYNGETSEVGELAQSMLTKFEEPYQAMVKDVETSHRSLEKNGEMCSLCGMQNRRFEPTVLYCQGACKMQRIKRHATYHTDRTKQNHWCDDCFLDLDDDEPIILDDGSEVRKRDLQESKNDALPEEGWVNCDECGSWVHQICALFNGRANKSSARYNCPNCYLKQDECVTTGKSVKGAKDLAQSNMSTAIEQGLQNALSSAYKKRAEELAVSIDQVEKAEGLVIRVLSNTEKRHMVGDEMLDRYGDKGCPSDFSVRTKCIAMFQKIHGIDTLLFAVYVYEYGHECAAPNRRRVYISYLDSVQYLEPKCYRTVAYHAVLVEYLRYVKSRGFHTAHIWSCPPAPGDDYIFYSHPQHQLIPRDDMLRGWYQRMLDNAKAEGVVLRTTTLYDEYFVQDGVNTVSWATDSPTCLPYFEGDYIPGELENIIKREKDKGPFGDTSSDNVMARLGHNLKKMKDNFIVVHLRSRRFAAAVERGDDVADWKEDSDDEVVKSKRAKISAKDSSYSYEGDSMDMGDGEENHGAGSFEPILSRHLGEKKGVKSVEDTSDADEPMEAELFESRQRFLNYCQTTHCQFDELRRAKHSSMMVLFQLHNPAAPLLLQQCGACYRDITHGVRHHCKQCSNFDLCQECFEPVTSGLWAKRDKRFKHDKSHRFTAIDMEAPVDSERSREDRKQTLKAHVKLLEHAGTCEGAPGCSLHNCQRMKKFFEHVLGCNIKPKTDCRICTRLLSLCAIHARTCTIRGVCSVPFCDRIRERNKRLRRQQQLMDDRRRQAQNDLYHTT